MRKFASIGTPNKYSDILRRISKDCWLYVMLIPGILYYLIFRFGPMFGLLAAFQNYMPFLGFTRSQGVGLTHFRRLFGDFLFPVMLRNTLILGLMNIFLFFPVPILLALMLNEVRRKYRNVVQTIVYIPHLVSWVVVAGLTFTLFSPEGGTINQILGMAGLPQINILLSTSTFRPMILLQNIWKESGWGTILFLATISAIDPTLYEAAIVDGAGRWHQLKYITFPSILPTIITLLTLRIGQFLDTGFEQIMLMINAINRNVGEVFDTYIYEIGIRGGQLSYSTAIGLFKSIIAFILVFLANKIVKKLGEEGIF